MCLTYLVTSNVNRAMGRYDGLGPYRHKVTLFAPLGPMYDKGGPQEVAFCCIPVRFAVVLYCLVSFVSIAVSMLASIYGWNNVLVIAGGFTSTSHLLIGITNILGLLCVWLGIAGVVRSNKEYVYLFLLYQVWHLLACLGATLLDAKVFWHCDSFITDYASAVEQFGFTPVMYDLALENDCNLYRSVFLYCSVFSFFLWSYAIYFTMTLYGVLARDDRLENFTHRFFRSTAVRVGTKEDADLMTP